MQLNDSRIDSIVPDKKNKEKKTEHSHVMMVSILYEKNKKRNN
jgi:hypothetical protein